ncbi:MAG: HlyD family efflux transporter periplasmic adaptor subunit [bacterium]
MEVRIIEIRGKGIATDRHHSSETEARSTTRPPRTDEPTLGPDEALFRAEALEEFQRGHGGGRVLQLSPRWTDATFRILLAMLAIALVFLIVGRISQYASGPAIVRVVGDGPVAVRASGTVERVLVLPGDAVNEGDVIVRLWAGAEESELERARAAFELHLAQLLRNPQDESARAAAAAARPGVLLAEARLEERLVRAPRAGRVSDVRIQPGQLLAAGDPVVSIVAEADPLELVAFLPGRYRPLLEPGMALRIEVEGYAHAYEDLAIAQVGEEVIGPDAARRSLGADVRDAVLMTGPVVLVRARLPETFRADGEEHSFFPGMTVRADARIRTQSILVTLVPGLEAALEKLR